MKIGSPIYGIMAEFDSPQELVNAARLAYETGYRKMSAYTPFPLEELAEALQLRKSKVPLIVLLAGIIGCLGGFYLQYWISVEDYPIVVGGKPYNSWPAFIPVTFELTILFAAFGAVLG